MPRFLDRMSDRLLGTDYVERDAMLERDAEPLEGTRVSMFNDFGPISQFWAANGLSGSTPVWALPTDTLAQRVWVASRCIHLNAQQISRMPIHIEGRPESDPEPAWLSNPDPNWFPNGIGDALYAAVSSLYSPGYAILYVTDRYQDGYPRYWSVLDAARVNIKLENGRRAYKYGETPLDPRNVIQIDRNPGVALHGTSALSGYAAVAYGLLAASTQSQTVSEGAIPKVVLKSKLRLQPGQAERIQERWMERVAARNGAPAVIDDRLEFEQLSFSPQDLALLDTQEWNARILATAFGVPAPLLNMALQGGMTYQNPAALGELWWRTELRQTASQLMDALSAQALPRGQWVWLDAKDTFLPLTDMSTEDDPQASNTTAATPAQQPLRAIGGSQ